MQYEIFYNRIGSEALENRIYYALKMKGNNTLSFIDLGTKKICIILEHRKKRPLCLKLFYTAVQDYFDTINL